MDDPPQPGPRLEMIYFCDGEGSFSTGLGEEVFLLSGKIATQDLLCEADCSFKKKWGDAVGLFELAVVPHHTDSWQ